MKKTIVILLLFLISHSCAYHNTSKAKKIWMEATLASFERKHTKALLLLQEATKLDPEFAPAWMSQGKLYESLELNQKARECYEEALTIYKKQYEEEPKNIDQVKDYAEVLWLLGKKKESLRVLNQAIRQFPEDNTLLVFKKMILKQVKKKPIESDH